MAASGEISMTVDTPERDGSLKVGSMQEHGDRTRERLAKVPIALDDGASLGDRCWAAVAALVCGNTPERVFRYGDALARINCGRNVPVIEPLGRYELQLELDRVAEWYRTTEKGDVTLAYPPMNLVSAIQAMEYHPLPEIERVIGAPAFSSDGRLHSSPGYNSATRAFLHLDPGLSLPVVPAPSRVAVSRARGLIIDELLADFPFLGAADRAHAIACLVLPFVRAMIDGPTPLHLFESPTPGTGKSLLVEVLTSVVLGSPAPVMTMGQNEEETRKKITAMLGSAPTVLTLDNVVDINSPTLAAATTGVVWVDRWLGQSKMVRFPIGVVWVATGNNVELSREVTRRTLLSRLDTGTEDPSLGREFRHRDLRGWARANRGDLVWAVLVLVTAWLEEGRPEWSGDPVLASFERWTAIIGGILQVAEVPGFLGNLEELRANADPETEQWKGFVEHWSETFPGMIVGVNELFSLADDHLDLRGEGDLGRRTSFGRKLQAHRDRVFGEFQIVSGGPSRQRAKQWTLRRIVESAEDVRAYEPGEPGEPPQAFSSTDGDCEVDPDVASIESKEEVHEVHEVPSARGSQGGPGVNVPQGGHGDSPVYLDPSWTTG